MSRSSGSPLVVTMFMLGIAIVLALLLRSDPPGPSEPTRAPASGVPAEAPREAAGVSPAEVPPAVRLVTWNLLNLGRSKDARELAVIADVLRDYDLVAVQEISTGPAGAQAVARLVDALERRGSDWDYTLSDPTTGNGSERYAYLWKPSRLRLVGRAWLEASLADALDREPYLARFEAGGRRLLAATIHAVPRSKRPDAEIAHLDALHAAYPDDHLLIMGDFNLSQRDKAFDALKALGFAPVLEGQKTSLRMKPTTSGRPDAHLANEYDNIFYETAVLRADTAGVIDFTGGFTTLREARTVSDHLPVFMHIQWN